MTNERTNTNGTRNGGLGIGGLCTTLTIVFVVLKLTGVISWSWFWVLFPTIFCFGLIAILLVMVFGFLAIMTIITKIKR